MQCYAAGDPGRIDEMGGVIEVAGRGRDVGGEGEKEEGGGMLCLR